jgi:hypothetical protein
MNSSTDTAPSVSERARSLLQETPYGALRAVSCEWREGWLILRGRLPSYFLKQMAQAAVGGLPGVERVVNNIEVVYGLPGGGRA